MGIEPEATGCYNGRPFERVFFELSKLRPSRHELVWPVITPGEAKSFRNVATKLLVEEWKEVGTVRRSMLDDGVKCAEILEAMAVRVIKDRIGTMHDIREEEKLIQELKDKIIRITKENEESESAVEMKMPKEELGEVWSQFELGDYKMNPQYKVKRLIMQAGIEFKNNFPIDYSLWESQLNDLKRNDIGNNSNYKVPEYLINPLIPKSVDPEKPSEGTYDIRMEEPSFKL